MHELNIEYNEKKSVNVHTHLATGIGTLPELVGWVFFCADGPWQTNQAIWKANNQFYFIYSKNIYYTVVVVSLLLTKI